MTKQTDLTYTTDSMFARFLPESEAGHSAWNQLAEQTDGTGKVFLPQLASTIAQLRRAGYVVRRARPTTPLTDAELADLLN